MSQFQFSIEPLFSSPANLQTSHLWRIPVEIREAIYWHTLPRSRILYPSVELIFRRASAHEDGTRPFKSHEKELALARTCQAFYTDLIPFYYRTKTFSFEVAYDLYRYLYMIGPYRRQLVQNIDFWLRGGGGGCWNGRTARAPDVYEWACEMLRECVSLRKLGVGVSGETKDYAGPVRGLDALKGMVLKDLQVRVREIDIWPSWRFPNAESVWDIPLAPGRSETYRFFVPEVVGKLEERLRRDMQASNGEGNGQLGSQNGEPDEAQIPEQVTQNTKGKKSSMARVANRRARKPKKGKKRTEKT